MAIVAVPLPDKTRDRIDVRLKPDQKTCIEKAAEIKGVSVTDFIVQNALETATRTIQEHETWVLSRPDAEVFFRALLDPPKPGHRIRRAAKQYRQRFSSNE